MFLQLISKLPIAQFNFNIVTCMSVVIDAVWIGYWIYGQNSELKVITALSLISTIYKSLLQTLSSPARNNFNSRFLVTDVNN
jgi:hypothetical protein